MNWVTNGHTGAGLLEPPSEPSMTGLAKIGEPASGILQGKVPKLHEVSCAKMTGGDDITYGANHSRRLFG